MISPHLLHPRPPSTKTNKTILKNQDPKKPNTPKNNDYSPSLYLPDSTKTKRKQQPTKAKEN